MVLVGSENYVAHKRLLKRILVTENKYRKLVFKIFAVTQILCYVGGVWDRGSGGVFSVQGDYVGSLVAILAQQESGSDKLIELYKCL